MYNTKANYNFVRNVLLKEPFGSRKINKIKLSDAKLFLIHLQDSGKGYSSIHTIRGVLRPAFQMAVDDEWLLRNPFEFPLGNVIVNDTVARQAITPENQVKFMKFIEEDDHYHIYYDPIFILLNTGLRISEFCGLTVKDIDFENNLIHVNHQLQRTRQMEYVIEPTKTNAGTRDLPMTPEVREVMMRIIENRKHPKIEPIIDGHTGFLFYDENNKPKVAQHWEKYIQLARNKYNASHILQMQPITPHILRHTYCTNMARAGMNPKTLQYLMGHSDISITLNVYTHLGYEDAALELERLQEEVLYGSQKNKRKVFAG